MSHRLPSSSPSEIPLQRGKACISCRRRKMRCDGQRPFCGQCIRSNRTEDCEYTDNQGRTRTQMLEEHVALLQARIHELESPRIASQSVQLYSPYPARSTTQTSPSDSLRQESADMAWWELEEPPAQITEMLIGNFLPHATTLGFAMSIEHVISDIRLPRTHPERPHPALLYSILLWAIHLSGSQDLMQHENLYLQRSTLALQDALGHDISAEAWIVARRRLQAIQSELLLAQYLFTTGRLLEGRYHASAAVSLAISCGLHHISPPTGDLSSRTTSSSSSGSLELPTNPNWLCYGEAVRIFWSVFILDRCWSVALAAPCALPDDPARGTQIDSDWPMDIIDYERIQSNSSALHVGNGRPIYRFLSGELPRPHQGSLSIASLRVMASAVYERTARLSQLWLSESTQGSTKNSIRSEMQLLARITTRLARDLIPVDQLMTIRPDGYEAILVVQALAHAAMMTMHNVRASDLPPDDMTAIISALTHASEIVKIIEGLSGQASTFVEPILSFVAFSAARTFIEEHRRLISVQEGLATAPSMTTRLSSLQATINRVLNVMQRCAQNGAIFSQQADEITELLGND